MCGPGLSCLAVFFVLNFKLSADQETFFVLYSVIYSDSASKYHYDNDSCADLLQKSPIPNNISEAH